MKWNFWKKPKKKIRPLKDNLIFAFEDHTGMKYYKFPSPESIGLNRLFKIQDYMAWMVRGLTADNLKELTDRMDELITDGLKTGRNGAKLALLVQEIRERNEKSVPLELVYNYLAVFYVREDERPDVFNEQVQKEKVEAFKISAESGNLDGFFFALHEYKNICALLNTTNGSWESIVRESQQVTERLEKLLKITSSENK